MIDSGSEFLAVIIFIRVTADHYYPDWESAFLIFLQYKVKNWWHWWGLNPQPENLILSQVPMTSQPQGFNYTEKILNFNCSFEW